MTKVDYAALIRTQNQRWQTARYSPSMMRLAVSVAHRLSEPRAKAVYQSIERDTGVPWFVIAVIHEREASQRWDRHIGQGDPFNKKTVHVPAGRGPFANFHDAAVDALVNCAPFASKWRDWSPGGALTLLMLYNGLGYEGHHIASPYLWSGTQHYARGKYVADGRFNPNAVDQQLGCAVLLHVMMISDPSIFASPSEGLLDIPSDEPPHVPGVEANHDPLDYPEPVGSPDPDPEPEPDEASVPEVHPASRPVPVESDAPDPTSQEPNIGGTKGIIAGRAVAGTSVATVLGGKAIEAVVGQASETADQISTVLDKGGNVIAVTKQVVAVPKPGFGNAVLYTVTSPAFLVSVIVIMGVSWFGVWAWQKYVHQKAKAAGII